MDHERADGNDDDDDDVDIGCKERVVLTSPEGVDENNGGRDDYGPTKTLHYLFDWNSLLPLFATKLKLGYILSMKI